MRGPMVLMASKRFVIGVEFALFLWIRPISEPSLSANSNEERQRLSPTRPTAADRVLLDEREGRAAATRHDVPVTGVVGILLRASAQEDLDLEPELDALRGAGVLDFRRAVPSRT